MDDRQRRHAERHRLGLQGQPQGLLGREAALRREGDDPLNSEASRDREKAA